ncbi:hypothetical protein CLU99_0225 [Flavobacterium sp. 2]|nr:hypothetical protein CLU99_0225 [Flavobacterium sp. 2]
MHFGSNFIVFLPFLIVLLRQLSLNAVFLPQIDLDMKRYFYFLSLFFIVASCTDDVKFNNPAFQALKENVFWRAQSYKAHLGENGSIVVEGSLGYEKVTLQMASTAKQTFTLGNDEFSKALYENKLSTDVSAFSTGTDKGSGQIVITDYDNVNHTISGTFKFTAENDDESNIEKPKINFKEGVFYKVPIEVSTTENHL